MIIYLLYCTISSKGYVGQTTKTLNHRWKKHLCDARIGRKTAICNAIRKYGADTFELSVLETAGTLVELNILEVEQIKKQGTKFPHGYNLTDGGDGRVGHSPSKATRKKLSNAGKLIKHTKMWNIHVSEAQRGKSIPQEQREKIRATMKRRKICPTISACKLGGKARQMVKLQ